MIRFIDLGTQISDGVVAEFAFYDTVSSSFLSFNGSSTWTDWEDFESCYEMEPDGRKARYRSLSAHWRQVSTYLDSGGGK